MTVKLRSPDADAGQPRADWRQLRRCAPAFARLTGEYERLNERIFREEGAEGVERSPLRRQRARLENAIALQLQRCKGTCDDGCRGLPGY
ncbi:hypothetical protein [Phytopseudomonas dryadis]|uniref:DUF465 domain-containing protein n=1 Tax=Phytopseudomonas dryadis TaxID=2487520 RepID=A0A4Q9QZY3_9GAMM|nr:MULTISPECIES: hypothetical protein [Pseudomonas]TBU91607.1 hypothetical protein DNK44_14140 [Pseudomonas dryadis]TBV07662.1 hypothetical protein DNK34_08120 [Pseudomonas dryadis]TBV19910.1 hypothetical protein DNK41_00230 [Pseudomonas sp. FRB 230]